MPKRSWICPLVLALCLSFIGSFVLAVSPVGPAELGLPAGNVRTSEPFVTRVYRTDESGFILSEQPRGYPFTVGEKYRLREGEVARVHEGIDFSSRPLGSAEPAPVDFVAGVFGVVTRTLPSRFGTIAVRLEDGTSLQYLHTSQSYVHVGAIVTPNTRLGKTGSTGSSAVHLHLQARNRDGVPVNPDLAFRSGQRHPSLLPSSVRPSHEQFDTQAAAVLSPNPRSTKLDLADQSYTCWIAEVIGGEGEVDAVLGVFPTYFEAVKCCTQWSDSRPDDFRLTREREVEVRRYSK